MAISIYAHVVTFSGHFYFLRSFFLYFFGLTNLTQQLLYRGSYFFRAFGELLFRTVTSSHQLFFQDSCFFRAKLIPSNHFLRIESSLGRLLFGTATFSGGGIVQNNNIFRQQQVLLHRIKFFRRTAFRKKLIFQKSNIPHYLLVLASYLFRAAAFSKNFTFCSSYRFRRATFSQHTFSEELLFQSYALLFTHCVKLVRVRSYSGPYFSAFGLNTRRYGVSLRIQSEYEYECK